jgi:hypothetical protein
MGVHRYSVGELHPSEVPQHIVYVGAKTQGVECFSTFGTSLFSRLASLSSSSADKMMKPYEEYVGV